MIGGRLMQMIACRSVVPQLNRKENPESPERRAKFWLADAEAENDRLESSDSELRPDCRESQVRLTT
jgi:hypothetical protein